MGRIGFQKLAGYTKHFHFAQLSSHSYCGFGASLPCWFLSRAARDINDNQCNVSIIPWSIVLSNCWWNPRTCWTSSVIERCSVVLAGKNHVLLHLQKVVDVEFNNPCNFVVARSFEWYSQHYPRLLIFRGYVKLFCNLQGLLPSFEYISMDPWIFDARPLGAEKPRQISRYLYKRDTCQTI